MPLCSWRLQKGPDEPSMFLPLQRNSILVPS